MSSATRITEYQRAIHSYTFFFLSLGLSHEQLQQLRTEIKATGVGQQGRSRSDTDLHRAVLAVGVVQQHTTLSFDQSIKLVAEIEVATPRTIRSAVSSFAATGTINPPSADNRGRSNPDHPLHNTDRYPLEAELTLHRHLHEARQENTFESVDTLLITLKQEVNVNSSATTLRR